MSPASMAAAIDRGSCILVLYRKGCVADCAGEPSRWRVHSLHAADCGTRVAVRFRDIVAFGDSDRAGRTAAVAAHLLPRSWRSFLRHGSAWPAHPLTPVPTLRQPACPFGQSLRAITTVTISADFTSRTSFGLAVANIDRQLIADAVATRVLRRSAPRGPPSSFSV